MTANTAQRVDVEQFFDAIAEALPAMFLDDAASVRGSYAALLLQVAELEEYRRLSDEANGTLKTMCAVAESKLAAQAAEIERLSEQTKLWERSFAGHVYVTDDEYAAIAEKARRTEAAERAREEAEGDAATERALQRAATELPEEWQVCVFVEQGSGWVELCDPDGESVEFERSDRNMAEQINEATDTAVAAFLAAQGLPHPLIFPTNGS